MIGTTQENSHGAPAVPKVPYMNTLTDRVNKAVKDGYTDNLKVTKQGLYSTNKDKTYAPADVQVKDFSRFEGQSDPADNAILYVIETQDGVKGTLIDAYGAYADENVNKFMTEVEEINKKNTKK
jgi:hypothetical protein